MKIQVVYRILLMSAFVAVADSCAFTQERTVTSLNQGWDFMLIKDELVINLE